MTVNIEDAGFEIRDVVAWVYGSGFPKSLNVGKAIDTLQGNEREVLGEISKMHIGGINGNEGWGIALKPAMELWTLARKSLSEKTVALNVLKWGTGGINIDGCRVEGQKDWCDSKQYSNGISWGENKSNSFVQDNSNNPSKLVGRFPANVIHDGSDEVIDSFPNAKGQCGDLIGHDHDIKSPNDIFGVMPPRYDAYKRIDDSKSASRFFYCAKASKSERNKGCEDLENKPFAGSNQAIAELKRGNTEFTKENASSGYSSVKMIKNNHPTVKPIALMRYLCRLITPKGGTVLDPYAGSGSTLVGAKVEGFDAIGIERESDYCKIAQARVDAWKEELPPKPKFIQPTLF